MIAACDLNQKSYEDETLKHGVFTYQLLCGIKGEADGNNDGEITVNELYDYVAPKVQDFVFKNKNKGQTPCMRTNYSGVFVINRFATKPAGKNAPLGNHKKITYCSRCGESPGKRTSCIGLFVQHDFVSN